jgi:6-phosphogluconolactonase (cycloisomerase 2 family)
VKRFYFGNPGLVPLITISFIVFTYVSAFSINRNVNVLRRAYDSVPAIVASPSVTIDPVGHFAFVANLDSDDVSSYQIDPATGSLRAVSQPSTNR